MIVQVTENKGVSQDTSFLCNQYDNESANIEINLPALFVNQTYLYFLICKSPDKTVNQYSVPLLLGEGGDLKFIVNSTLSSTKGYWEFCLVIKEASGELVAVTNYWTGVVKSGIVAEDELAEQVEDSNLVLANQTMLEEEILRVIAEGLRNNSEASRDDAEGIRNAAEEIRAEAENLREAAYTQAELNRGSLYATAEGVRNNQYLQAENNRNNDYDDEEQTRNNDYGTAEITRDGLYATAEQKRDNDYETAELTRDDLYTAAEGNRDSQYSQAEDDRDGLYRQAETGRDTAYGARVTAVETDLSTHKLDYASQMDNLTTETKFPIINLIANGSFETDSNSDGLADGFLKFQAVTTIDNVIKFVGNASQKITAQYVLNSSMLYGIGKDLIIPNGNKVYASAWFKQNDYTKFDSLVRIAALNSSWTGALSFTEKSFAHNNWGRLSGIGIWNTTKPRLMVHGRGKGTNTTSDFSNVDGFIAIDLTTIFGANNEPTASEMDTLMTIIPNSWFDGTLNLTQTMIVNWQLKMIRQNRTAIIALGGTIV